jgi:polygalacturonase
MTTRRDFLRNLMFGGAAVAVTPGTLLADIGDFGKAVVRQADGPFELVMPGILKRIKAPVFPKRDFLITKFGATANETNDSTEAFRKAIAACNSAGGGRVVVPAGTFVTGAIHLKSNVNLHVSAGATIKFSKNPGDYLPVVFTRWEGTELMNYSPFIYAFEQTNIAITGEGTLDGQSGNDSWWPWNGRANYGWKQGDPNQRADRAALQNMGEQGVPVNQRLFGAGHYLRPQFIQPYRCKNVLIEGVRIINSPMWEIHPVLCTNVTVSGVKISSRGPNNDGCDPESCTDILIENCDFDTGDDCIAIKSGRNADGRRLNAPTQNIIIRGCRMRDGHGGITVGSEISGGVRNLFAEKCRLDSPNLDHALRVKNNATRGGLLENFYFRDIEVGQVAHAVITIDFNYEEGAKGNFTPVLRNYSVDRLVSEKSKHVVDIQGLANAPIYDLRLDNCTFNNAAEPSIVKNVKGLNLVNVKVNGNVITQLP